MILVDTSVWIEHLRQVLCHPFVIGELACETLQKRREILTMLNALPEAHLLEHEEVMSFLEARHLYGRGIGWVDAHLLASTLLTRCTLWTFDKPLRRAAAALNVLV
jgi:predicted nucleic acid-binding protein